MKPFNDSTDIAEDGTLLRERMQEEGYLFIRGLLPGESLESLRTAFLGIAREAGWARTDTPPEEGIADLNGFCVEPEPAYMDVYADMYSLEAFHALQHHPNVVKLLESMAGEPILPHSRIIARTIFPQREAYTTPAHQDFIPIQGTAETYTAWIPLSDLPPGMGGLQVAAGSHRKGVYDFKPAMGAGGIEITDPLEGAWVNSPFAQGDVLFFHSMLVHKGLPNRSDRLRMSIDARYQRTSDPIAPGSILPHSQPNTWENIYRGWKDESLKYYWEKYELEIREYDNKYHDMRDRMAFDMAEAGDETAVSALQRIIARHNDPAMRERAAELLARFEAN
ncbi:MAG: phytanoyl-CoA dioxygenase family protein [Gemmatimonadetes bacterium]|nr:phytanoyl-CoA dioxygenase family protein [Gemmatimonadota bacterium]